MTVTCSVVANSGVSPSLSITVAVIVCTTSVRVALIMVPVPKSPSMDELQVIFSDK